MMQSSTTAATDVHDHDNIARRRHHRRQRTTFNLVEIDRSAQLVCRLNRLNTVLSSELRHIEIERARSAAAVSSTQRRTCRRYVERSIEAAVDSARTVGDRQAERRLSDVQHERRRRLSSGAAGSANDVAEYQPGMISGQVGLRQYVDRLIGKRASATAITGGSNSRVTTDGKHIKPILGTARSYTDVGIRYGNESFNNDNYSSNNNNYYYYNELYYYYNKMRGNSAADNVDALTANTADEKETPKSTTSPREAPDQPEAEYRENVTRFQNIKSLTTIGFETPARPRRTVTFVNDRRTDDVTKDEFASGKISHRGSSSSNNRRMTPDKTVRADLYRQLTNLYSYNIPSGMTLPKSPRSADPQSATVTCHLGHHSGGSRRHHVNMA